MSDLFATGRIVDLILVFMLLEGAALAAFARGVRVSGILWNLAAGGCLLLALRCALTGAEWPWIAAALLAALAGHVGDLACRQAREGNRGKGTSPSSLHAQ
jgi:lysylphosphatidylglycerol synthetase-like protein (DUF2156 family)